MYKAVTAHGTPVCVLDDDMLVHHEFESHYSSLQTPSEADSTSKNATPLQVGSDNAYLTGSLFDQHFQQSTHRDYYSILPPAGSAECDLYVNTLGIGSSEGLTNDIFFPSEMAPIADLVPTYQLGFASEFAWAEKPQTNSSTSSAINWRKTQGFSADDLFHDYYAPPETTCPSEITVGSSAPSAYKHSLGMPPDPISAIEPQFVTSVSDASKLLIIPNKLSRTIDQSSTQQSQCQDCKVSFTLRKDLERHKRTIHIRQRWLCEVPGCRRSFNESAYRRKDALLLHLKVHSGAGSERAKDQYRRLTSGSQDWTRPATNNANGISRPLIDSSESLGFEPRSKSQILEARSEKLNPELQVASATMLHGREKKSLPTCTVPGCSKTFSNHHDLGRHKRTVHLDEGGGEAYKCVACPCSDRIWTRLDNFKKHLRSQHQAEDVIELVLKSKTTKGGAQVGVSFTLTTPEMFSRRSPANLPFA